MSNTKLQHICIGNHIASIRNKKGDKQFEEQITQNLISKLKRDEKGKKTETADYIKDCFGDMLDNSDFIFGYQTN